MKMKMSPYWNETAVYIYGLLAGFSTKSPKQVSEDLNRFVNAKHNVTHSLRVLKELELARLAYFTNVDVQLGKYRDQIEQEFGDTANDLLAALEEHLPYEFYDRVLERANTTELLNIIGLIPEALHDCLSFDTHITNSDKLRAIFANYLEDFQHDNLYDPDKSYAPFAEQKQSVLFWLDGHGDGSPLIRIGLPDTTRFLETVFSLASQRLLSIQQLDLTHEITSPAFSAIIKAEQSEVKHAPQTYDTKKRQLTFLGATITMEESSDQETLCNMLFHGGKPVKRPVEKGDIYDAFGLEVYGKSAQEKEKARRKIYSAKDALNSRVDVSLLAGSTGFEPAISSVTGRRDNHFTTSPRPIKISKSKISKFWLAAA